MEPRDKKPWLIPGDEGGGDGRRAVTGEAGELLKAKKRESPGLLSPNTGEARTDPGSLWGTAFIIFLKVLLS